MLFVFDANILETNKRYDYNAVLQRIDVNIEDLRNWIGYYLILVNNVSSTNSEQCKLCVNGPLYIDARLLWKQTIYSNYSYRLMMKLSKLLCLECSTCAMFFSSSFTVSIMALFLCKSLSETLINTAFMLLFNLVISCIPSAESLWEGALLMWLLLV